MTHCKWFPSLC